jgi:hypothetical protein
MSLSVEPEIDRNARDGPTGSRPNAAWALLIVSTAPSRFAGGAVKGALGGEIGGRIQGDA